MAHPFDMKNPNFIYLTNDGKTFHHLGKMNRVEATSHSDGRSFTVHADEVYPALDHLPTSITVPEVTDAPELEDERPTIITVKATYHDSKETYKGVGYALKYSSDCGLHIHTADGREIGYHPPGSFWSVKVKKGRTQAEEKALRASLFKDSHDATTQPPTGDRYNFWRFK